MDIAKIVSQDEGEWFDLVGDARVKIKPLNPKVAKRLVKRCTTIKWKKGRKIDDVDIDKVQVLIAQEVVIAWEKIDKDGQPMECTPENIKYLTNNLGIFNRLIDDALDDVEESLAKSNEEAEKN